ncbi:MAG TPA: formyltransferase family protein, partial [Gemmatimonadales bacterium]|nr:formyltransferase family protein [Gemmatimonadales bacterium]
PPAVIAAFRDRIINIHPALLPSFGGPGMYGLRVHQAVLASGAKVSGCTVHLVDEEYDRGPILAQSRVPVLPGDTAETLAARVLEAEHQLLPVVVRAAAEAGRPIPLPQPVESNP